MPGYDWSTDDSGTIIGANVSAGYTPSYNNQGTGQNNQNQGNGDNGGNGGQPSTGHDLLDQYNKLVAEGKGDTTQAQELARYLGKVEQKYQSKGESLYPEQYQQEQYEMAAGVGEFAGKPLTDEEKVYKLAGLEAGDPFDPENRYAKSFEGKEFIKAWKGQDEDKFQKAWVDKFGLPSIVMTPTYYEGSDPKKEDYWTKDPIKSSLTGDYLYSGLGKSLMDQLEGATGQSSVFGKDAYASAKETYWDDRTAQEERTRSLDQGQMQVGGGGGGGSGGGGYYGDPRRGNPIDQYANFYTPQANLQQAMVNVHGTPTGFQMKRGGIVSLLRLN